MNSSAIIRSASPTVSIPGQTASASSDVSFGDVMEQITDNWAERNAQVQHDTAKNAQAQIRENIEARRSNTANSKSRDDYTKPDAPRTNTPVNNDDRDRYDDVNAADTGDDAHPARDVADKKGDNTRDDLDETKTASTNDPKEASGRQNDEAANADQPAKVKDETVASADPASRDEQTIDPNMVAVPSVNPAAPPQTSGSTVTQTATGVAGTTAQPVSANPAQNAEGTIDGLMNSTALSQPAAGATAKSALNGLDGTGSAADDNDSFIAKVVDAMSGEGNRKSGTKTENSGTSTSAANANNSAAQQNPASTGNATAANGTSQAAQQAMAAAANVPNMQPGVKAQTATNGNAATTINATGSGESTSQTANGTLTGNSKLTQGNSAGQTAHTARSAPAQQVQQQVAVHIRNAASEGVDKISVQLRPEHLGRVDVKLEISHDGRVQGVIQADTRETLDMLRQDSRALQQALKDAGLNADSQSFTFEHRNEGGQSQEGNGQSRMANNSGSMPDEGDVMSGAELAEHVAIGYGINPNGLVDVRI